MDGVIRFYVYANGTDLKVFSENDTSCLPDSFPLYSYDVATAKDRKTKQAMVQIVYGPQKKGKNGKVQRWTQH